MAFGVLLAFIDDKPHKIGKKEHTWPELIKHGVFASFSGYVGGGAGFAGKSNSSSAKVALLGYGLLVLISLASYTVCVT